jgi:hypothetical protein
MSPIRRYPSYLCVNGRPACLGGRPLSPREELRLRRFHRDQAAASRGQVRGFHMRCLSELALTRRGLGQISGRAR